MTQAANDQLVLLTSYFNLAGGRRQDTADTFRVEASVPSSSSPDGVAALYIVTEASAGGHMGPRARRLAADTIAWEYQQNGDVAPPQRLKAAFRAAHEQVSQESDGHVAVGASVIAVEGDSIYLAQTSPGQVYVLHNGELHSIASQVESGSAFSRALGSQAGPRTSLFRDEVAVGDVLALCSSWFSRAADPEEVRDCFGAGTADDIAEALLELARSADVRDATAIVIEAANASDIPADDEGGETLGFLEQVDSAVQALAGVGRMLWGELRSVPEEDATNGVRNGALRGAPQSVDETDAEAGVVPLPRPESPTPPEANLESTAEYPAIEPFSAEELTEAYMAQAALDTASQPYREDWDVPRSQPEPAPTADEQFREQDTAEVDLQGVVPPEEAAADTSSHAPAEQVSEPSDQEEEQSEPQPRRSPIRQSALKADSELEPEAPRSKELDAVNARLGAGQDMAEVVPPVQAFPDTSTQPSRIYATSKDVQAANKRPRRFGGISRPAIKEGTEGPQVIRPGLGDVDLRRPMARPAPPAVVWGVGVLFLLLIALAGYLWYQHRHTTAATNPYPARVKSDVRKANASSKPATQDTWLAKARSDLALAQQRGDPPANLTKLSSLIAATSDSLHHITRVKSPPVLANFGTFAGAQPTEIAAGPGIIFVLDVGRKSVFSVTPNSTSNPVQIVTAGEGDSGYTIGNPQQVATDGATALVLDDKNVLVRSLNGAKSATSLTPGVPSPHYVQMVSSDPDVYLLDTASSQVWRFPYGVSGFTPPANQYFDTNKPDLSNAVSFVYDGTDLYILKSDGSILKFDIQANAVKFVSHTRGPLTRPVAIYSDQGLKDLWIADPVHHRIVQIDKNGNYVRSYVSPSFSSIKSMAVGPAGNTIYVLIGKKILAVTVVH
jgi:hypothetical protein